MASIYEHATNRASLARTRNWGDEPPKCAAYFDHTAECDIPGSHICGPSEMVVLLREAFNPTNGETK